MRIVAVVGSRSWTDKEQIYKTLDQVFEEGFASKIISGGATGADSIARRYAKDRGIDFREIRPDYKRWGSKLAPIMRNCQIAQTCDFMISFWDGESKGTRHVMDETAKLSKHVILITRTTEEPEEK